MQGQQLFLGYRSSPRKGFAKLALRSYLQQWRILEGDVMSDQPIGCSRVSVTGNWVVRLFVRPFVCFLYRYLDRRSIMKLVAPELKMCLRRRSR